MYTYVLQWIILQQQYGINISYIIMANTQLRHTIQLSFTIILGNHKFGCMAMYNVQWKVIFLQSMHVFYNTCW